MASLSIEFQEEERMDIRGEQEENGNQRTESLVLLLVFLVLYKKVCSQYLVNGYSWFQLSVHLLIHSLTHTVCIY